jgi:hypothetical protein
LLPSLSVRWAQPLYMEWQLQPRDGCGAVSILLAQAQLPVSARICCTGRHVLQVRKKLAAQEAAKGGSSKKSEGGTIRLPGNLPPLPAVLGSQKVGAPKPALKVAANPAADAKAARYVACLQSRRWNIPAAPVG